MTGRSSAQRGFISLLAIIAISGLVVGIAWAFNAKRLATSGIPFVSKISEKLSQAGDSGPKPSDRKHGDAKLTAEGVVDTPYIDDGVTGGDIYKGGVVARTLKNGVTAYFIIPSSENRVAYAEIAEFSKLPTSATHIPLYTTYGNGINVAVEGKIVNRAYLVFDFSKGKVLEEFKTFNKYVNYCDFSTDHFYPEACAGLLRVPIDQTSNKKYIAASPKHVRGDSVGKETVVFLEPTHHLGTDDLLVVEITKDTMVIPQPVTSELLKDLLADALAAGRDYSAELMDLFRVSGRKPNLRGLIGDLDLAPTARWGTVTPGLKGYFTNRYISSLYNRAGEEVSRLSGEEKQKLFGGWGPIDFSTEAKQLQEDAQRQLVDQLKEWSLVGGYRPNITDVAGAANLRRAYEAKVKGSARVLLGALRKTKETMTKHREEVEDTSPSETDLLYAVEVGRILSGDFRYTQPKGLFGRINLPFARGPRKAHAQVVIVGEAPEAPEDPQAPPPSGYFPPTEEPDGGTEGEIDEVEQKIEEEVRKTTELIKEKIAAGELALEDLLKALEVAGKELSEEAWEEFEKKLKEALDTVETDDQTAKALKYCHMYHRQLAADVREKCQAKKKDFIYKICYVDKLPPPRLKVLADTIGTIIKCPPLKIEEQPIEPIDIPPPPPPPPDAGTNDPPLEDIRNQP